MRDHGVLKVVIGVFAAVFLFHQIYSAVYRPITTQSAEYYEAVDGLKITGTIIRDEKPVVHSSGGVLHFLVEDGTRVSKNGTIANVYNDADSSVVMSELDAVTKKIADIEELQNYNNLQASDLNLANTKVSSALNKLIFDCSAGNFITASSRSDELISSINHRQIITGEQTDFSAQLASLNDRLQQLNQRLPQAVGRLTAERSGYFVSVTDGYETVLGSQMLDDITPEFLKNLTAAEESAGTVGKIVSDYEWYIAAKVTINDSLKYKVGDTLQIRTTVQSMPILSVTVHQINMSQSGEAAVIIFSCNQLSSELASMRTGAMTVIRNVYSGLRLPKRALRVVDGETGVYVRSGATLKFVTVKVVYQTEDMIICEQQQSNSKVLRLYDEVVVKGKNLYDGKIIG